MMTVYRIFDTMADDYCFECFETEDDADLAITQRTPIDEWDYYEIHAFEGESMNEPQYFYNVRSISPLGSSLQWPILDKELMQVLEARGYIFELSTSESPLPAKEHFENYLNYRTKLLKGAE